MKKKFQQVLNYFKEHNVTNSYRAFNALLQPGCPEELFEFYWNNIPMFAAYFGEDYDFED